MFLLTTTYSKFRYTSKDVVALESRLMDIIGDEVEAKRIATIASSMKFGEVFSSPDIYLKCKIGGGMCDGNRMVHVENADVYLCWRIIYRYVCVTF